ncbi:MAG: replication-associated recombination protein A [Candidatus Brocadiia bacterium]
MAPQVFAFFDYVVDSVRIDERSRAEDPASAGARKALRIEPCQLAAFIEVRMSDLFNKPELDLPAAPLAERMRPKMLSEFLGPDELSGPGGILASFSEADPPPSLLLWGPPGCGKTTLARLLTENVHCRFVSFSAVLHGVKEIRRIVEEASFLRIGGERTVLFVDEIHRFNKAQQDAFLPYVENGTIILIGATTENPSFEVIPALLSRCRVVRMPPLSKQHLSLICQRAIGDSEQGLGKKNLRFKPEAIDVLCELSNGDARTLLNILELASARIPDHAEITETDIMSAVQTRTIFHDKAGDYHYNLISAFHKSMRGSDPDAALHYFWRMIEGGDDPLFLLRRMFNFASEDIGTADPQAMLVVNAALSAFQLMGPPEGLLPIGNAVVYLATAPKSNAVYRAFSAAHADVVDKENMPVPDHIINAPTRMMKEMGFGSQYKYPHDFKYHYVAEEYLPENLRGARYYFPEEIGFERELLKRMEFWCRLKERGHREPRQG